MGRFSLSSFPLQSGPWSDLFSLGRHLRLRLRRRLRAGTARPAHADSVRHAQRHRPARLGRAGAQPRARDVPVRAQSSRRGIPGHLPRVGVRGGQGEGVRLQRRPHRALSPRRQAVGRRDGRAVGHRAGTAAADHALPRRADDARHRQPQRRRDRGARLRRPRRHGGRLQGQGREGQDRPRLRTGRRRAQPRRAAVRRRRRGQLFQRHRQADRSPRSDGLERHQPGPDPNREDDVGLHPLAAHGARSARPSRAAPAGQGPRDRQGRRIRRADERRRRHDSRRRQHERGISTSRRTSSRASPSRARTTTAAARRRSSKRAAPGSR